MEPVKIGDLLGGVLKQLGSKAARADLERALRRALAPRERAHCRVAGFRAGRLTIEVDSAPLYAELRGFRAEALRAAVNQLLGKQLVAEIAFRMGGTAHV
jgi:hypothetical protein